MGNMDETDSQKQRETEALLAYYKQKVDILAGFKVNALQELVRQAKEIQTRKLAEKIKKGV